MNCQVRRSRPGLGGVSSTLLDNIPLAVQPCGVGARTKEPVAEGKPGIGVGWIEIVDGDVVLVEFQGALRSRSVWELN